MTVDADAVDGPGPLNGVRDVGGVRVGHAHEDGPDGRGSGVTVVIFDRLTPLGVDVRGGGPATRETDLLRDGASVRGAHAVVFSGGSVFGLAAADAVAAGLSETGVGVRPTPQSPAVPIAPAACLFDLGAGAPWGVGGPPYARLGAAALAAARADAGRDDPDLGAFGAGRGARAGRGAGGVGEASLRFRPPGTPGAVTVAALVAANPVGDPLMSPGDAPWAWPLERVWRGAHEFGGRRPDPAEAAGPTLMPEGSKLSEGAAAPRLNTMLALVVTDAPLQASRLTRVAAMAQDGFALSVKPAHTPYDGDIVFAAAVADVEPAVPETPAAWRGVDLVATTTWVGAAAAECVARAVARAVFAAREAGAGS